ncbi:MAG: hypothetical protein EZS28_050832 [Streblomastix strix]|uniref:HIT-type domain-containing protein n=1 Tax=Streblomastix strix TaxID=222440 RepID=A0A5J4T7F3_9EUKA|nr:MAG: hypothetical protein EZS28_050832 [Streblomastix strix]
MQRRSASHRPAFNERGQATKLRVRMMIPVAQIEAEFGLRGGAERGDDEEKGSESSISKRRLTRNMQTTPKDRGKIATSLREAFQESAGLGDKQTELDFQNSFTSQSLVQPSYFCTVCGFNAPYSCVICYSRFCSIKCMEIHKDTRCLKYVK